jgi:peptide/nickel transport system substrate-binding protein
LLASLALSGALVHAQTPAPKSIVVAVAREPDRFYNPLTLAGQLVANLVFDPLVGLDDRMMPYPALAAAIPSPDNGLVRLSGDGGDRRVIVTMPLRADVTWNDGTPFTADDVVYTWQLMMNPASGFDTSAEDRIKSVDRVDDHTVQFVYLSANEARAIDPDQYRNQGNEPVIDPRYGFGLYDAPAIYPRHKLRTIVGDDPRHAPQVASVETSDFARRPVGTGPYVLSSWDAGSALTFTSRGQALPQRQGQPAIDVVTFRIMPDKNDSLGALTRGDVHVVAQDGIDAGDSPALDALPGVQTRYTPGNAWEQLTFNLDNPILADPAVRQAIAFGLNRPALNEAIMFSKAEIAAGQVPSWSWGVNPGLQRYEFNPGQADQLLTRAGWVRGGADGIRTRNGQRLALKLWSTPASFRPGLMAMIKDQLAQLGIDVSIDTFPSSQLFDVSGTSPQALANRQFDIAEFAWVDSFDPGADGYYSMHSGSVPSRANGYRGGNYSNYKNPRSDTLLDQLQASLDPGFRRIALNEAQTIWQADLPVLPLLLRPVTTAVSTRLVNFRPTPALVGETWNIEQWDLVDAA